MEFVSAFDMFKIGLGPSSSHTMGPWKAARLFLDRLRELGTLDRTTRVRTELFGSLAKTGKGHGTDLAVVQGLADLDPVVCDPAAIHERFAAAKTSHRLSLAGKREIEFDYLHDIIFNGEVALPFHPNALRFAALFDDGSTHEETYYSVGGGFVVQEEDGHEVGGGEKDDDGPLVPFPISSADELQRHCEASGLTIPEVVLRNELAIRSAAEIDEQTRRIWAAMVDSAHRGAHAGGTLPGGLNVLRRAAALNQSLLGDEADTAASGDAWIAAIRGATADHDFARVLKWVSCFALAVNEENAAFGRVVTAPTNGAAGVIPAVLLYRLCFHDGGETAVKPFLLTAAVIGSVFKKRATISAALGGCQAEIGVSSAMAAAGLTQSLGGSTGQALMAAEIAMEHHLGLTCDPVGGLVQIPCIERNTMGAVKAITASLLALEGDPARAKVSLDAVIRAMWETAKDMRTKYKETSEGGLAVQVPVNVIEC